MRRISMFLVALVCGVAVSVALAHPGASSADSAAAPAFSSPNPLTFDFVAVGTTSEVRNATVTNTGTAPLKFSEVLLGGRDVADFHKASDSCTGATLAPSATCAVGMTFSPSVAGTRYATLRFTDNTPCQSWISIAGSGVATPAPATATAAACDGGVQTTTHTVTTTTPAPAPVSASSVVKLSSVCSSRRTVDVGLDAPKGKSFKTVRFLLHGKTIKTLKGKSIKTKVSLVGLPRGRFTLEVRATTTDGRRYVQKHYYVTCVAKKS